MGLLPSTLRVSVVFMVFMVANAALYRALPADFSGTGRMGFLEIGSNLITSIEAGTFSKMPLLQRLGRSLSNYLTWLCTLLLCIVWG